MSESPALIYLEADDEITSVVRRVRSADAPRVVIVAPGRSRATSSAVALRLLARAGEESGGELAIVGDALTRSLAAEAGLAAFATVDDARSAEPGTAGEVVEPRQATINVVRGAATDDTISVPTARAADELTQAVPVVAPRTKRAPRRRRTRRSAAVAVLAGLGAVLLIGFVAGAAILPAATITLVPRSEPIGPVPYVVEIEDPERLRGTAEATTTVTATDTFEILEPATGEVVLFNWTFSPVAVPAGTFVAAGEQAFATQADVVVPRGRLIGGGITAGEIGVAVEAAAPGLDANVEPGVINVVVNQDVDARLRGFPENQQQRVVNPDATSGGLDESGPMISQADVDAAIETLRTDLRDQVGDALAEHGDEIVVQTELGEPVVEGADELVGAHEEEGQITATLEWEAFAADPAEVREAAREQFEADPGILPEGHVLLADSVELAVEEASMAGGGTMRVDVTATGRSAADIDSAEVFARAVGRTPAEAEVALADLGAATVSLWPGWVSTVPGTEWRIDLRLVER